MPKLLVDVEMAKKAVAFVEKQTGRGECEDFLRALTPVSEGGEAVPFKRLSECSEAVEAFLDAYGIDESEHEQHGPEIEAALRAAEEAAGY